MPARRKSTYHLEASGYFRKHPERKRVEPPSNGPVGEAPKHFDPELAEIWEELKAEAEPGVLQKSDRLLLEITTHLLYRVRHAPDLMPRWLDCLGDEMRRRGLPNGAVEAMKDGIFSGLRPRPGDAKLLQQCLGLMYMTPTSRCAR